MSKSTARVLKYPVRRQRSAAKVPTFDGGFVMLGRRFARHAWDAIHGLPSSDRPVLVLRLFFLMAMHTHNGNEVRLGRKELAEKLGCAPHHVSGATKVLQSLGLITVGSRPVLDGYRGRPERCYFINSHAVYSGSGEDHQAAMAAEDPPPLLRLAVDNAVRASRPARIRRSDLPPPPGAA